MPSPAYTLYPRSCSIQVGSSVVPADPNNGFHVSFRIKRGVHVSKTALKPHPNTCDLKIWDLQTSTRKAIEQAAATAQKTIVPCIISAGYEGHRDNVFNGQLRAGMTTTLAPNVVTELSTGDGDQALVQRMNTAFGKGSTATSVVQAIVKALGIGQGNLAKALSLIDANALGGQLYARGVVLKGAPADIMTDVCRSLGLEWSIQNGALSLTQLGQPLDSEAVLIDEAHGMVGAPSVDTRGILSVTTAMIPGIVPGTKLSMNAANVTGGYKVLSVETTGDNFENEWVHRIEAQRY